MMSNLEKINKVYEVLKIYNGRNPFILNLKKDVYVYNKKLTDFQIDFIINNHEKEPIQINKIIKISDWFGAKKQSELGLDFTPALLKIITYLGETDTMYCCYVQYRKSVSPSLMFIPKSAVLTNFFVKDFNTISVDFERYNRLSSAKDPNRYIKPHQEDAIKFLLSRKKCILADDMGLGKTLSLSVASIEGNFDSVLIICPASLKTNWKNELMWYVPEKDISIIESFNNKNKNELEKILGYGENKSNMTKDE